MKTKSKSKVSVRTETVTPTKAAKWLQQNTENRNVRPANVTRLAHDIEEGRWIFTGDPIRFDTNDTLIDGQHRLMAIVAADLPVDAVVIRGLSPEARIVVDTGTARSLADTLKWMGLKSYTSLSTVLRLTYRYNNGLVMDNTQHYTNQDLLELLDVSPSMGESVDYALGNRGPLSSQLIGTLHYVATQQGMGEEVEAFIHAIQTGENLSEGPVLRLRNRLLAAKTQSRSRMTMQTKFALTVKTFNAFVEGSDSQISWSPVREKAFPTIVSSDSFSI